MHKFDCFFTSCFYRTIPINCKTSSWGIAVSCSSEQFTIENWIFGEIFWPKWNHFGRFEPEEPSSTDLKMTSCIAPSEWCPSPAQWRWSMSWRNGCDWWFRQMTVGFFYVVCWNLANTISTREADCTPHSTMSPPWNCSPCNGPAFNTWTTVEVMSFLEKLVSVMS